MRKDKSWLLEKHKECIQSPKTGEKMLDEGYELALNDMFIYINQLDEPQKPVIPQFVADWIDAHDLHGNNPLREYRDLEIDFNEGWTDEKDAAVYHWTNKNPYAFIDALRYGYEVEKEKMYRVRAGNRYVRFNLDGSIIGVKKDNSTVCLERLSKLPFDYKKAVESGIITLEEVTPCN